MPLSHPAIRCVALLCAASASHAGDRKSAKPENAENVIVFKQAGV